VSVGGDSASMVQDVAPVTAAPVAPALRRVHLSDVISLVVLAGFWGGSFLFMRVATPEFGPVPLIAVRVAIAALVLTPVLAARGGLRELRPNALPLVVIGVISAALPFSFLAFATLSLTAGFTSILNATAPFFAAIVAYLWLGDRLSRLRVMGLVIGFAGVLLLVWGRASIKGDGARLAMAAGITSAICYGIAANYTKVRLSHIGPLATATGCQIGAAVCWLPLAVWWMPRAMPSLKSWLMVGALGIFCTAMAYILYFRLIARLGPARAVTVTFLVPAFGMLWGRVFLKEAVTWQMVVGTAVILVGTSLTTGLVKGTGRRRQDVTALPR
jgi:drug/metabolite transporter (DMT)-like permease